MTDQALTRCGRVGYVVSRFPKTTETFIAREMNAVAALGWHVTVFAIFRERHEIVQTESRRYLPRLSAISELSFVEALAAHARLLRRRPRTFGRMWWRAIAGNVRSRKFLLRAMVVAWGAPKLGERAVEARIDHLHAHWGTHSALLAHLISMITDIPYSVTLHAHDLHVERTMLATKLAHATRVVTISEHNAEVIRREFPDAASRTTVIRCGIDTSTLVMRAGRPESRPPRIATVARLHAFKGHRYLLDALALLEAEGLDVACDIVGDGPLRDDLESRAGPNVTFHGAVDVETVMEIVRGATVFAAPSVELADGHRDGIPVSMMEAMAVGVPVVASDVSGIPELVVDRSTGLLVPPGDPHRLADAIAELIREPGVAEPLIVRAREAVERSFALSESGRRMSEIFSSSLIGSDTTHV